MKYISDPPFDIRDWFDPTITLPGWFGEEFIDEGGLATRNCVLAVTEAQDIVEITCVRSPKKRKRGSSRDFREPEIIRQIREEDEEILGIISEFLFLEAA